MVQKLSGIAQVEEVLRTRETQLAEAQAIAHLGSWEWDVGTKDVAWSDELYHIYGITRAAFPRIRYEDFLSFVHPDDRGPLEGAIQRAFETKGSFSQEHRIVRPDGEIRTLHARGHMQTDAQGAPLRMMGTGQDISDRKRIEEELVRAKDELEKIVAARTAELQKMIQARDEFLSIASHELKTPLTTLRLQTQIRLRDVENRDHQKFTFERMERMFKADDRQIVRLARLIDDMLDVSRINTGKLAMETEEFDLTELARDVIERASLQIVDVRLAGEPVLLGTWDRHRMEQVLMNLITNAAKYGGGSTITVRLTKLPHVAEIRVEDRGLGIPREDHERIFDRFERAVNANEVSGLGLGLYIVKQIVQAHRGTVRVESEVGEGATFIIELPYQVSSPGDRTRLPRTEYESAR